MALPLSSQKYPRTYAMLWPQTPRDHIWPFENHFDHNRRFWQKKWKVTPLLGRISLWGGHLITKWDLLKCKLIVPKMQTHLHNSIKERGSGPYLIIWGTFWPKKGFLAKTREIPPLFGKASSKFRKFVKKCLISTLHCTGIMKYYIHIGFSSTLMADESLAKIGDGPGTVFFHFLKCPLLKSRTVTLHISKTTGQAVAKLLWFFYETLCLWWKSGYTVVTVLSQSKMPQFLSNNFLRTRHDKTQRGGTAPAVINAMCILI